MKFSIILSWSKVMALVIIILVFVIDLEMKQGGSVFMFSIPFAVFLITGKQFIDSKNNA